jgi:hypothetical protein
VRVILISAETLEVVRMLTKADASSSSNHFGRATHFKVQVNFDIPVFEGHIDAYDLEKWLNLLEGYFFVHNFFDREKITFSLLELSTMSNIGGKLTVRRIAQMSMECSRLNPLGIFLWM